MHNVKAAELESIRQPAQRRREKRQRPDFDAPVFRLSALARVIRTQAAKKKGRKIDVDPAFPPEIRGASDADLASTSAESPPARKLCVHQFKIVTEAVCGNGDIADAVLTFNETCLEDVIGDAVRDPYQSVIRIR